MLYNQLSVKPGTSFLEALEDIEKWLPACIKFQGIDYFIGNKEEIQEALDAYNRRNETATDMFARLNKRFSK